MFKIDIKVKGLKLSVKEKELLRLNQEARKLKKLIDLNFKEVF